MSDDEARRKTHTSSTVKNRYNAKVYAPLYVQLPKDLVARFKEKCAADGVSVASVIRKAIEDYLTN